MIKFIINIITIIIFTCSIAQAAAISLVSGTFTDGESIEITGSDFGSTGPNVLLFDDFENGTNGNTLADDSPNIGSWFDKQTVSQITYSNSAQVSGSLSARFDIYDYPPDAHPCLFARAPTTFDTFYVSWWTLLPAGNTFPGCGYGGCNWKTVWILDDGGGVADADVTVNGNGLSTWQMFGNDYPYEYSPYFTFDMATGTWYRMQFYIKGSTSNDGQERVWITELGSATRLAKSRDRQTLNAGDNNKRQRFSVNGYVRSTPNSYPTFDDVYIAYGDSAQARVEIGDSDSYTGCGSITVCTPTSWGDTTISCTFRGGAFLEDETAYVYVTDADGSRSAGYEVTIGAGTQSNTTTISVGGSGSISFGGAN